MKHKIFTEEVEKIALYANIDKRIESIDSIEYPHETGRELICKNKEIKY